MKENRTATSGEEKSTIGATVGLSVLQVNVVKALANGAGALVSSKNTTPRGSDSSLQEKDDAVSEYSRLSHFNEGVTMVASISSAKRPQMEVELELEAMMFEVFEGQGVNVRRESRRKKSKLGGTHKRNLVPNVYLHCMATSKNSSSSDTSMVLFLQEKSSMSSFHCEDSLMSMTSGYRTVC